MRIAVILPASFSEIYYDRFQRVFQADFPQIDVLYLFYNDYKESPELLEGRQREFDAVIFAGAASFHYTESRLRQETVWLYLPREGSAIYRALLLALKQGMDITRLSFDTYERNMVLEAYGELGYDEERLHLYCFSGNSRSPDYNKLALDFHRECLRKKLVSGCITRLNTVAGAMEQAKMPYIFAHPTINTIREQIEFAQKLMLAKESADGQFVVLSLELGFPPEFTAMVSTDYAFVMSRMQIASQIYRYADLISGSVVEQGARNYLIFSTKEIFEAHTNFFRSLPLLDWLVKACAHRISIGVGYGKTVADAHRGATKSLYTCQRENRSCAVLRFTDGSFLTMEPSSAKKADHDAALDQWQQVAAATGLSTGTVAQIAAFTDRIHTDCFTAEELSQALEISRRSADRLLEKLETAGYACVMGREVSGRKGRPARIVQVFLTK